MGWAAGPSPYGSHLMGRHGPCSGRHNAAGTRVCQQQPFAVASLICMGNSALFDAWCPRTPADLDAGWLCCGWKHLRRACMWFSPIDVMKNTPISRSYQGRTGKRTGHERRALHVQRRLCHCPVLIIIKQQTNGRNAATPAPEPKHNVTTAYAAAGLLSGWAAVPAGAGDGEHPTASSPDC